MLFESKADGSLAAHATQARELERTQPPPPRVRGYAHAPLRRVATGGASPRPAARRACCASGACPPPPAPLTSAWLAPPPATPCFQTNLTLTLTLTLTTDPNPDH